MASSAYEYWERVDEVRGDISLSKICSDLGINYHTLRVARSSVRFPKRDISNAIAGYLGVSEAFLMFGDQSQETPSSNTRADAIIERLRTASDLELTMVEKILGIGD